MTNDIINNLPDLFKNHISTLKRISYDDKNSIYMCESDMKVINFDKIPKVYSRGKGWPAVPTSNDALYITTDEKWYFIEFKNGSVDKSNIYRKIYDSLIILIELGILPDFNFVRENAHYILVYNSEKYSRIPKSESRDSNFAYIQRLSKKEEKLFEIGKFEKYLFKETHTYTKELFIQNFVLPMQEQENSTTA